MARTLFHKSQRVFVKPVGARAMTGHIFPMG